MSTTTQSITPTYLSLRQAAAQGYGGYSTLRAHIASGQLQAVRIGGRVRVRPADLEALVAPARQQDFDSIEAAVERIAGAAPPLTDEQVRRLSALFGGGAA